LQAFRSLLLCALLSSSVWLAPLAAADPAASPVAADPFADVVPGALPRAEAAARELSDIRMRVALDPAASTIGGEMTVTWRNPAREPLSEVWFRLFPNAGYYGEGNLAVEELEVNGVPVTPEFALDETALRAPLPRAIAPGESAEIDMAFTTTIPTDSTGSYGILTQDTRHGSWVLADWFPILAVYEEGTGWALPPVTPFGDPTYAPSAFYDVALATPADLAVVATGVVTVEGTGDGVTTRRFIAGPARDFVIVADDDAAPLGREVAATEITLWTSPDLEAAVSRQTLAIAADAFGNYGDWFGPYPARSVDLVQVDPSGALGIAWSGLLFLDGPSLLVTSGEHDPERLAAIVAHEISHLWWGILVGGDSNAHGYIQEGLATVSSLLYIQEAYGSAAAARQLDAWVTGPALRLLDAGDAVVDIPAAEGQDEAVRANALYGKGSLGFLAIRQEIGGEAFNAALHDVASRYAWGEMTPGDLRAAFERASGQDLTALWSRWFDEAAMTRAEIDRVVAAFNGGSWGVGVIG
jgi:hypothetical protein